ncbi:MAG: HAD family hydrolase [Actinomycetota bacterium]|nr:HAD family hydrolase [Actinomycetota bacterium]
MRTPLGLVIFDCDGVLVDTERISVRVDVAVLAELGWELTEAEVVERFMGRSHEHMLAEVAAHVGGLPDGWDFETGPRYRQAFAAELQPVDGVVEALDRISLPVCVASSGSHEKMRFTLGLTGLYERFAGRIFSTTEVANGKPAPDLFLHAARSLGVPSAACAVVEDSRYGVEAARRAGMRAFGYAGGLTPRHLLAGPSTVVFDEMRDLPALLTAATGDAGEAGGAGRS